VAGSRVVVGSFARVRAWLVAVVAVALVAALVPPGGASSASAASSPDPNTAAILEGYRRQACPDAHVPPPAFRDVDRRDVHAHNIACLLVWEVTQGRSTGRYDPLGTVTRAQMATFVHRTLITAGRRFAPDPPRAFTDVSGVHAPAIDTLARAGIVRGVSERRFAPNRPVTRAEAATLLHRAAEELHGFPIEPGPRRFDDVSGVHADAITAMARMVVVTGVAERRYAPDAALSRAQMASMLARLLGVIREMHGIAPPWRLRFHRAAVALPLEQGLALGVADLTGDGRDDLVVLGRPDGPSLDHWLYVFHAGDRGLELVQAEPTAASGSYPPRQSLTLGRFTDGGGIDVALPTAEGGPELWRNDGSGRFRSVGAVDGARTRLLVAGDVSGNGFDDLVSTPGGNEETLQVRYQSAPGVFSAPVDVAVPPYSHYAAIDLGDLDGDGRTDLAVIDNLEAVTLFQRAPGVFEPHRHPRVGDALAWGGAVGDVTGDGADELVLARDGLDVHRFAERGPAAPPERYAPGTASPGVAIADLTGDGRREVVASRRASHLVRVYLQGPGGGIASHQDVVAPYHDADHQSVGILDATGNGKADVVLATSQHGLVVIPRY
jgi:hypothetical protein